MKVGLVSFHSFLNPGGVKNHILNLHKEFKRRGIDSKIIAPRRTAKEKYGKDLILLGTSFPFNVAGTQGDFVINFNPLAIDRMLQKEKFDILHFHNFGFPSSFQILERSRSLNILTFHANLEKNEFLKYVPFSFYILKKAAQWKIDGIIGVASFNLDLFKKFKGPKAVIPNGIDFKEFNPRIPKIKKYRDGRIKAFGKLSLDPEQRRRINILFVGRIEERKGLIYLLKAYEILQKKFNNLRLIIIGEGELKEQYENWVKKRDLKEVRFEGTVTGHSLASYYTTCDIFVSPAIFGESFGIVLLEAMACGTPVAAFANRGYKEFLGNKKSGRFLVKPRAHKKLAQKIELLIRNKKLRKKMSEWGIKDAQNYAWPKIADRVLDFYKLCLENKNKNQK